VRIHLTILRLAARLTPREQREEWFAEWRSELWYVCQAGKPATAFCLGSFKDALWLRRNSPPSQEGPIGVSGAMFVDAGGIGGDQPDGLCAFHAQQAGGTLLLS
jgi:hypothetical protein